MSCCAARRPRTCLTCCVLCARLLYRYVTEDWWRLLTPSQRLNASSAASAAAGAAAAHRRRLGTAQGTEAGAAPRHNLSFLYSDWGELAGPLAASAWSLDTAGFGAHYLRALWHALHSPNLAVDMQSPVSVSTVLAAFKGWLRKC